MFKNLNLNALGVSGRQSESIELALSNGFKGLDLNVVEFADQVRVHGLPHARRLLDSAKLKIGSFALPIEWQHDDEAFRRDLEKLPNLAALAAQLGCTRAVTFVEPATDERHYHQNFEFHQKRFTEIARTLQPAGVRLGVGFRGAGDLRQGKAFEFVHSLDALVLLLSMVSAPNIGVVLDLWDLVASGGTIESVGKLLAGKGDKLVAVQLADATAEAAAQNWPSAARLLPGESGVIDATAALQALAELGYDGPVTPVPHPSHLAGQRRDAIVKRAGETLDKAWKAAGLAPARQLAPTGGRR
jgi:sugar phosphate isomerase/epimerase